MGKLDSCSKSLRETRTLIVEVELNLDANACQIESNTQLNLAVPPRSWLLDFLYNYTVIRASTNNSAFPVSEFKFQLPNLLSVLPL